MTNMFLKCSTSNLRANFVTSNSHFLVCNPKVFTTSSAFQTTRVIFIGSTYKNITITSNGHNILNYDGLETVSNLICTILISILMKEKLDIMHSKVVV